MQEAEKEFNEGEVDFHLVMAGLDPAIHVFLVEVS